MKLLPTLQEIKTQAKAMKAASGAKLAECYEELAHQHGYKDWNTLRAVIVASSFQGASK